METKASLNYARVGAQKARLVADMVRGKNVDEALKTLTYMNKKTAILIKLFMQPPFHFDLLIASWPTSRECASCR